MGKMWAGRIIWSGSMVVVCMMLWLRASPGAEGEAGEEAAPAPHMRVYVAVSEPLDPEKPRGERVELELDMPMKDALPVLKAAATVGSARFQRLVISQGLMDYRGTTWEEEILDFLAELFEAGTDLDLRGSVLMNMWGINPVSKQTRMVLEKAATVQGQSPGEVDLRETAHDILRYLETGDPAVLEHWRVGRHPGLELPPPLEEWKREMEERRKLMGGHPGENEGE